jgi:AcrR family transcriptional regulator
MSTRAARRKPASAPAKEAPRRLGRPRDPEVDRALLDATLLELAEHGFTGMSVEGVAARCGIGKTAIYRRYEDKAALAIAALAELAAKGEPPRTGDLVADLTRQLEAADANLQRCGSVPLLGTLLAELERHPELIEVYRERLLEPRTAKLTAILKNAQSRGEVAADADLRAASLLLVGFLSASYIAASRSIDRARLRAAVELVVAGLKPSARR